MNKNKLYFALTAIVLMAIIIAQNTTAVETKILFFSLVLPQATLIGLTLVIGMIIGFALTRHWSRQKAKADPEKPAAK